MLCRTKQRSLSFQLKYAQFYQSSTKSRMVRKAPDCKFDPECPPKRCVPPVTVCHTLPKQKCVITVKQLPKPPVPAAPAPTPPPCVKLPDYCSKDSDHDIPWYKKMLPNEENMSPTGKMAYGFLKFNAKALIAGGSVYLTAKCGVWGSSEQTAELYKKSHNSVTSLIKSNAGKVADVPDSRELVGACKHYWNKGVIFTISSMVILPTTLKKWVKDFYKQVADSVSPGVPSKAKV